MCSNEERIERKFSIYDLFWNVLEKWRLLLVCMIFFAVVFVAYGIFSNRAIEKQNYQLLQEKEQSVKKENEKKEEEEKITVAEKEQVESYWDLYQQYVQQKDYVDHAVLMKLDAENLHKTTVKFYIDKQVKNEQKGRTETDENFVRSIKGELRSVLEETTLITEVEKVVGSDGMKYSNECIDPDISFNKVTESSVNIFAFAVIAPTKEQSEAIAQKAIETMEIKLADLKQQFGEFEVFVMSNEYALCQEQAVLNNQRDKHNALYGAKNTLAAISAGFTELQVDYLFELSDGTLELESSVVVENEDVDSENEGVGGVKNTISPIVYCVVGLLVGVLFVVFLSAISYLNDKKIRFYSLADENMSMRIIQMIVDKQYMNSNFIDKFIFRTRYRNLHLFTEDEAFDFAVADVKTTIKKRGISNLYLSVYDMSKQKDLAEKMKKELESNGICVEYGNSVLYDAQAMEKLADKEAIVFLEECNKTLYTEIEKEKMICEEKEIQVLGMIVGISGNN